MNRQLLALAVGTATVLTCVGAAATPPPARTLGPVVVGWWSVANRNPAVPAVAPPDAGPRDLYVAGANALPADLGVPGAAGPVAIAALRFRLPAGAAVQQLRLRLAGVHPPAVTMTACRALRPFAAAYAGAWGDAPPYDCRDAGTARLGTDGQVVLDGVERLRRGRDLAVVLVPGPLDRVVVAAPDARTLTVTAPAAAAGSLPAAGQLPPPAPAAAPGPAWPGAGAGVGAVGAAPLSSGRLPVVQPPASTAAPVVSAPARAAASTALPARPWPALVATLLLALLAFVPLVRPRRREGAVSPIGERGVGRFRSERSGTVPDLA